MIGIDTNVLLRFLVHDDPKQGEKARQFMTERTAEDPAYVSAVVLAEVIWFLRQRLNYSAVGLHRTFPPPKISLCEILTSPPGEVNG